MRSSTSLKVLGLAAFVSAVPAPEGFAAIERSGLFGHGNSSTAFTSCLSAAGVAPVMQSSNAFANDSAPYNLRLPYVPAAVVYPQNAEAVAAAVKCAAMAGLKVNARSGGHSYAAFGLGGEDGHVIVSLDNLKELSVDIDGRATIGAGNRLGDIALGIWEAGGRAMAHGTCPYVGIGGHTGHGGFGLSSRNWGTVLDQTVEMEVVMADGAIVTASKDESPELFWALQGAASSFGIVTSFKTITHAAPKHSVWFTYTWSSLSASQASRFMQLWQQFATTLPANFGFQIHIVPQTNTTPGFIIDGYLYGDEGISAVNATMAPLLKDLGIEPNATDIQDQTWMQQIDFLAGVSAKMDLNTSLVPDSNDTFYATSIFISEDEPMIQASSDALMQQLWTTSTEANDEVAWYLIFDLWGGEQSYITNVSADATAFDARDALYSIQLWGQSLTGALPMPSEGISLIQEMVSAITDNMPETKFKGYMNYVDSELSREEAWDYYFPTHLEKLRTIKTMVDPMDVFSFPQSISPWV